MMLKKLVTFIILAKVIEVTFVPFGKIILENTLSFLLILCVIFMENSLLIRLGLNILQRQKEIAMELLKCTFKEGLTLRINFYIRQNVPLFRITF